jgi:death on curing protein
MMESSRPFEPIFLTLDEVLEIHDQQVELYGGSHGLRDAGALESAVATPQATFGGEYLYHTVWMMAAAYLYHLVQNHAFIDGNKRAGANTAMTFLYLNGFELDCTEDELVELVLGVAQGRVFKEEIAVFFEGKCRETSV